MDLKISKIDIIIAINIALIALVLCLINYTNIDVATQNLLFDFQTKTWLVDRGEPVKKFIFYQFPKILLGITISFFIYASVAGFKNKASYFYKARNQYLLILLGLALIPLIAGNIKKFTNVYCPTQLEIYGGNKPYVKIFNKYPSEFIQDKKGKCFPAGHAVTCFSLFILFFALSGKKRIFLGLILPAILGSILNFYQMAKGAHFIGDGLVSMLVCFLIAALIARIILSYHFYQVQKGV
jgi:membrane-associated PAP2 superfamily phosphatase